MKRYENILKAKKKVHTICPLFIPADEICMGYDQIQRKIGFVNCNILTMDRQDRNPIKF